MNTLRIALCEDDPTERQHLSRLLAQSQVTAQVLIFTSGEQFLAQFRPYQFDLILMDIFMSGLTGIEVITQVRALDGDVPVAFITSSHDFTLESYRLDALKYIEKPATQKSVDQILQIAQMQKQTVNSLEIRIHNTTMVHPLSRILYLEQQARTLLIHLCGGEVVSANKKLSDVEEQLLGKGFLRCHKSYLVNLAHVNGIDRELCVFEMSEGNAVYIRRRSFWEMQKAFETYLFAHQHEVQP